MSRAVWSGLSRGLARWLRKPAAAAVLGLVLLLDACSLPRTTAVGRVVGVEATRTHCYFGPLPGVYRTDAGIVVTDAPMPGWPLTFVTYRPRVVYEGVWAPTTRAVRREPHFDASALTPQEVSEVYARFAEYLVASPRQWFAEDAALLRAGPSVERTRLWSGYAHNGVALLLAAGLVVSCRLVARAGLSKWREGRSWARLSRGLCPACAYDLGGLERGSGCPECGWPGLSDAEGAGLTRILSNS